MPDFLTVEEAAAVMRIGRTAAYEATRQWRATDGAEGIPVVRIGGTLRVPRRKIEELAGGPIEVPTRVVESPTAIDERWPMSCTSSRRGTTGEAPAETALQFSA